MAARDEKRSAERTLQIEPEKELVTWTAPSRPFKRRDRQFYVTAFAIAGIISLILFLAEGLMPVLLIVSMVFLAYVLSTVEPDNIEYKITNRGVRVSEALSEWANFRRYWFSKSLDNEVIVFQTFGLPGRIDLVINPEVKQDLRKEVSKYIPYEEVAPSGLDRVINWVAKKLPGSS